MANDPVTQAELDDDRHYITGLEKQLAQRNRLLEAAAKVELPRLSYGDVSDMSTVAIINKLKQFQALVDSAKLLVGGAEPELVKLWYVDYNETNDDGEECSYSTFIRATSAMSAADEWVRWMLRNHDMEMSEGSCYPRLVEFRPGNPGVVSWAEFPAYSPVSGEVL